MKVFGAAFDALPDRAKIAVKRAYMAAMAAGRLPPGDPLDPYDALAPLLGESQLANRLEFIGKATIPPSLSPRPPPGHGREVSWEAYRESFYGAGSTEAVASVRKLVAEHILPGERGVMIGVDHSLTAGFLTEAVERFGPESLGMLVLDGHLDAIRAAARARLQAAISGDPREQDPPAEGISCQNFLGNLLESGRILPGNLIVAGLYSAPDSELLSRYGEEASAYLDEYDALCTSGVTILTRDAIREDPACLTSALAQLDVEELYVSLDMDICASSRVPAVRFHDSIGLTPEELSDLATRISALMTERAIGLAGVDVMEIDIHLVDVVPASGGRNETLATAVEFLEKLLLRVS